MKYSKLNLAKEAISHKGFVKKSLIFSEWSKCGEKAFTQ